MTAQLQPYTTEAMYLEQERCRTTKHEYYAGSVYAIAGASEQHNIIALNIAATLHAQLRRRSCRAYPSAMRVKVMQTGLNTYPDFTIVCGQSQFTDPIKRDTIINPTVIIEILSPFTERDDRGMKFQHYRTMPSLQEYILISQDTYHIERFVRQGHNEWVFSEAIGLEASIPIPSIQTSLAVEDVYEQVVLLPDIVPGITRDVPQDE